MKNKFAVIFSDFFYNILSSFISTGVTQLVLYPILARNLTAIEYGEFLTTISVVNIITLSLGNNLATTRLIRNDEYRKVKGDFNFLLLFSTLINYVILYIYNMQISLEFITFNCVALASSLTIIRSYLSVAYRLKIDYKKNLIMNIMLAIGSVISIFIFASYKLWPIIYIISNLFGIIYILYTSNLLKEKFVITSNFKSTFKTYIYLILSGFIGNLTTYLDRLIIYPILGATYVSVFSVASFLGKSLALVVAPITGVLLSYLCNNKFLMTKKLYKKINILFLILAFIVFLMCVILEKPVTRLLYPTVYENAKPYILIANFASILGILSSFNGTITLKYAPSFWQVIISIIKVMVYILLGIILMNGYQLYGFTIALIITNSLNSLLNFYVGYYYLARE